ncbi:hypothetical protein [Sphingosinicella sp.]|uniref:hypothetical protein n=1 Tax=Sphingosinicella sp. TaxID=1917971 RepID=UPI00403843EA
MKRAILIGALALAGCVAGGASAPAPAHPEQPPDDPALSYGGLNEDIRISGLVVRPLAVTEDSRCPVNVTCVWAGRVVLRARVSGLSGEQDISSIEPLVLPDGGTLDLAQVWPPRFQAEDILIPYRFGFRRR